MGLSGLLASFLYMNFALLIGQIYVFFRVLNDGFHRGKKSGLMHVVAEGGWGKTETVLPKNGSQSFSCTHARHVGIPRQCGGFSYYLPDVGYVREEGCFDGDTRNITLKRYFDKITYFEYEHG